MSKDKLNPVLVTTEFRGVFFGYLKEDTKAPEELILTGARCCIYWSSDCGGFLGLASDGVTDKCRIGKRVDELKLYKITSITPVSSKAAETWERA